MVLDRPYWTRMDTGTTPERAISSTCATSFSVLLGQSIWDYVYIKNGWLLVTSYSLLKYVSGHIIKSQWKPRWSCLLSHLENACCKDTVLKGYEKTFYSPSEVPEIQLFYTYGSHGKFEVISEGDLSGQWHESLLRKKKKEKKENPTYSSYRMS